MLMVLSVMTVLAQKKGETIWNNVVFGHTNVHWSEVTKVGMYADRTEVGLRINYRNGSWISIGKATYLDAGGKHYPIKDATVTGLDNQYTLTTDAFDFTLIFEPVPQDTKVMDVIEPGGWTYRRLRSADDLPEGLTDTYWRNEATGDWVIGFTASHVIYHNRVWDIVSQKEKKDAYTLTLENGTVIKVGKARKGCRAITTLLPSPTPTLPPSQTTIICSPITTATLPDYPQKDTRTGFADNGYRQGDSVTIIGWLKDMPEELWKKGREFEVSYENILTNNEVEAYAKMDSLGRFTLKMPLMNSSEVFIDWQRTTVNAFLEPGETYFFLSDFKTGQKLWMGQNVRVQNELLAHPRSRAEAKLPYNHSAIDLMTYWQQADSARQEQMAHLEALTAGHPTLSQRYIDYQNGYYRMLQGRNMMQARYYAKDRIVPQEYLDYVGRSLWKTAPKPYTLYRDFTTMNNDFLSQIVTSRQGEDITTIFKRFEKEGKLTLTAEEKSAIAAYPEKIKQVRADVEAAQTDEEKQAVVEAFNNTEMVTVLDALIQKNQSLLSTYGFQLVLDVVDSIGCDRELRDIILAQRIHQQIDATRQPVDSAIMAFARQQIQLPAAFAAVKDINDKYVALKNRDFANAASLRPSTDVEGMSDGEAILRKIIEPYKGRIIYMDIWGTWCSPCKAALKESWKLKEAVKDIDIVYLYLCNRSSDESWKNVIKEYDLTGENCIHYNLPQDQQDAIEHYLGVNSFPTYKLIDKQGNIHDLHWQHHEDLESFRKTIEEYQ